MPSSLPLSCFLSFTISYSPIHREQDYDLAAMLAQVGSEQVQEAVLQGIVRKSDAACTEKDAEEQIDLK